MVCESGALSGNAGSSVFSMVQSGLKGGTADEKEAQGRLQSLLLLCSYLVVLTWFKRASDHVDAEQFLLAQMFPDHFVGCDIFLNVYTTLARLSLT
jgi:hypothetical protein